MKRSEMIKILQNSFIKHMNPSGPANSDEEMYSLILKDLEDAGMVPPIVESEFYDRANGCNYMVHE